jgi:hypothetical protein
MIWGEIYPWLVSAIGGFIGAGLLLPTKFGEAAIKFRFDKFVEASKAEHQHLLEQFRHELKSRDDQISAVRTLALSGLNTRTEILTKRRLQAAETVWASVVEYTRYRHVLEMTYSIKLDQAMETASQRTPDAEKVRKFAAAILDSMKLESLKFEATPNKEQIFVGRDVWARFTLYRSVMTLPITKLMAMREGLKPNVIKDQAPLMAAAKLVLPHMTSFIDEYGVEGLSYLNDLFEEEVRLAIVASFSDSSADNANVQQAKFILDNVNKATTDLQEKVEIPVPGLVNDVVPSIGPALERSALKRAGKYLPHEKSD